MRVPYASGWGQLERDEQLRHFQHIFQFFTARYFLQQVLQFASLNFRDFFFFYLDKKREGELLKKSSSTFFPKTFDIIARVHNLKANFLKDQKRGERNNTNIAFL